MTQETLFNLGKIIPVCARLPRPKTRKKTHV